MHERDAYLHELAAALTGSRRARSRLLRELSDHLEDAIATNAALGLDPAEAEREALALLGNVGTIMQEWHARTQRLRRRQRARLALTAAVTALGASVLGIASAASGHQNPEARRTAELGLPGATAASLPNPCTLLTDGEVTTALGSRISNRTDQQGTCEWNGVAQAGYTSAHATLFLSLARASETAFKQGEREATGAVPLAGIGQLAYATPGANLVLLAAWRDGVALNLLVSGVVSPLNTEKAVATISLQRA